MNKNPKGPFYELVKTPWGFAVWVGLTRIGNIERLGKDRFLVNGKYYDRAYMAAKELVRAWKETVVAHE